jgi:shikimate dehydrogenase
MGQIRLGLIGDNIRASRAPALHRLCGRLTGLDISYELFVPLELGMDFDQVFAQCLATLTGFNVTLPYKERAAARVRVDEPNIARIGAVNTVLSGPDGPRGFNTDYSGFIAAYRAAFDDTPPGRVVMFGAGGVGKAVAYALTALGASEVAFIDKDRAKASALAAALTEASEGGTKGRAAGPEALVMADGVVNCTPLGMVGYGGSPVAEGAFPRARWAFDAVYTPADTLFRAQALAAGAQFLSGYELYYWQGVDAFRLFTGVEFTDHTRLRALLAAETRG